MVSSKDKAMTPRQLARRNAILETVRTQLEMEGFDALSMRKIAAIAGVSPSTLYEIYGGKEALILYAVGDSISTLSLQEEQFEPGLDRFVHRIDSVASFFTNNPDTGEAMAKLLFQNSGDSPAKQIFLDNAVSARKTSLEEMLKEKEIAKDTDLDFYARTLISATWGTVLFWLKGTITIDDVPNELLRASLTIILPVSTRKSKPRIQEILSSYTA